MTPSKRGNPLPLAGGDDLIEQTKDGGNERGLRSRGDVTIWLSEDAIAAWIPPKNGLRGGQRRYSNLAIRTALTLRVVFGLPLRQTEGFLDSLLSLMSRDLKAPDHTTRKTLTSPCHLRNGLSW